MSRAAWLRNNTIVEWWYPHEKFIWIWGSPIKNLKIKNSFKTRLGLLVNKINIFNAYSYNSNNFLLWIKDINDYQPTTLYGYSSIILELSKYIIKHNLVVNQLQRVVSTTEKLESRDIIETAFGCPVYDQYGCREMPAIAIESEPGVMRVTDDIIALTSNSKNQFLGTALHSYGFPLINYKIGDCGVISTDNDTFDNIPFFKIKLDYW